MKVKFVKSAPVFAHFKFVNSLFYHLTRKLLIINA